MTLFIKPATLILSFPLPPPSLSPPLTPGYAQEPLSYRCRKLRTSLEDEFAINPLPHSFTSFVPASPWPPCSPSLLPYPLLPLVMPQELLAHQRSKQRTFRGGVCDSSYQRGNPRPHCLLDRCTPPWLPHSLEGSPHRMAPFQHLQEGKQKIRKFNFVSLFFFFFIFNAS